MDREWTKGPWKWWTSNSWRRLKRDDRGVTQNVLEPCVCRDGHPDCIISDDDMALIAASPDLFEALDAAIICLRNRDQNDREAAAVAVGRAALNKALGKET